MTHLPGNHHQQWKINLLPEPSTPALLLRHRQIASSSSSSAAAAAAGQKRSPDEAGLPTLASQEALLKKKTSKKVNKQQQRQRCSPSQATAAAAAAATTAEDLTLQQAKISPAAGILAHHHPRTTMTMAADLATTFDDGNSTSRGLTMISNHNNNNNGIFASRLSASSASTTTMMMDHHPMTRHMMAAAHPFSHTTEAAALYQQQQQQQQNKMLMAMQQQQYQRQQQRLDLEALIMRQRMAAALSPPNGNAAASALVAPDYHRLLLQQQQQQQQQQGLVGLLPTVNTASVAHHYAGGGGGRSGSLTGSTGGTTSPSFGGGGGKAAASISIGSCNRDRGVEHMNAVDAMLKAIKAKSPTPPIGDRTSITPASAHQKYLSPKASPKMSPRTTTKKTTSAAAKVHKQESLSKTLTASSTKSPTLMCRPVVGGACTAANNSIISNNDDDELEAVPPIVPTAENPVGRPLGIDEDANWLSELHSFMRLHMVELCLAKEEDVAHRRVHKPSVDGFQIGIRCRCCSHLPPGEREPRSTAFPSAMSQLYQSFAMMLRDHFTKCRHIPPVLRKRFLQLKEKTTQGASDAKQYWVYAAQKLGLQDSTEGLVLSTEAKLRAVSMPPFGTSDEEPPLSTTSSTAGALVTTQDKECGAPDFAYTLLLLARPVTLTQQERKGHKKSLPVGLPGFACRYCCELNRRGNCRLFPVRKRTLASKLEELYEHLERCTACPKEDKELLRALRARQDVPLTAVTGSDGKAQKMSREMKGFLDVVWTRINQS